MLFGSVQLENFVGLEDMPQKAASAWSEMCTGLTGAKYKPLLYCGKRTVRGVNHVFIAEQTLSDLGATRHIVMVEINEFEGVFEPVESSIVTIL